MLKLPIWTMIAPILVFGEVSAEESLAVKTLQQEGGSVLVLDSERLEAALQREGPLMINFYAPWCEHCKQLEPEFAKAAEELQKDGHLLGKVNCDDNEGLCDEDRWDLEGLPEIKVVRGGGGKGGPIHDFEGPRTAKDIAAFMRQVAAFPVPEGDDFDHDDDDDYSHSEDGDDDSEDGDDEFDFREEDGVLVLGEHNFADAEKRFLIMLVLFHNPGCDGCATLLQEYIEASDELYEDFIPVAKVDCFQQAELCQQPRWRDAAAKAGGFGDGARGVDGKGAPFLVVVREGEVFSYDDPMPWTAFDMVDFTKELAGLNGDFEDEDEEEGEEDKGSEDGKADEAADEHVLVLDESNFEQALADNDVLMLEFFAPWCGNCKRLRPRYGRAAAALAKEGIPARLAKVDCDANENLCEGEPWNVDAYPTLFLRRRGKVYEYDEPPEAKDIVHFVRRATAPALRHLATEFSLNDFIWKNEVAVIGLMEKEGSTAHQKLEEVAEGDFGSDRVYGVTFDNKIAKELFKTTSGSKVFAMRHFDQEPLSMQVLSFTKTRDIEAFLRGASKKLYLKMGTDEAADILSDRPVTMMFMTEGEKVPTQATREVMELAQTMGKNALAASDKRKMVYAHAARDVHGSDVIGYLMGEKNSAGKLPAVFIVAPGDGDSVIKYRHEGELTEEAVKEFERRYFAGELRPYTKSEPLSEEGESSPVKKVNADSFRRKIIDNDNDVLVDFYAPWCPHCARLAPIYADLAAKMAAEGRDRLVIADVNVSENDVDYPGVSTDKLPTVVMFKAGAKDRPETYDGELELEALEAFVNEMTRQPEQETAQTAEARGSSYQDEPSQAAAAEDSPSRDEPSRDEL